MAEIFKFFNSTASDIREYQAADFAEYFGSFLSTGLLSVDESAGLEVEHDSGLTVNVTPGEAIMEGHLYKNTTPLELTHPVPEVELDRIDRVVLRLDLRNQSRFVKLFIVEGEPSENPEPPALTRDSLTYEISLAQVFLTRNTGSISQSDITDERLDEDLCGLARSLVTVPTSQFLAEWQEWFDNIQEESPATKEDLQGIRTDSTKDLLSKVSEGITSPGGTGGMYVQTTTGGGRVPGFYVELAEGVRKMLSTEDTESIRSETTTALGTEVVSSLPTSNLFDGRQILLTEDDGDIEAGYYGYFGGEWV